MSVVAGMLSWLRRDSMVSIKGFKYVEDALTDHLTNIVFTPEPKRFKLVPKDTVHKCGYKITPIFDESFNLIDFQIDRIH